MERVPQIMLCYNITYEIDEAVNRGNGEPLGLALKVMEGCSGARILLPSRTTRARRPYGRCCAEGLYGRIRTLTCSDLHRVA